MSGLLNSFLSSIFRQQFENRCIILAIGAYYTAIAQKSVSPSWDEEDITAQLSYHIEDDPSRLKFKIVINTEDRLRLKSLSKGAAKKSSRIDLRFTTINSSKEYKYYLEAKNLRISDSSLKRRYISTGIDNFVSKKYNDGFIIGYVLDGSITDNILGINGLLIKDSRNTETILKSKVVNGFDIYNSTHALLKLNHLFFDFN